MTLPFSQVGEPRRGGPPSSMPLPPDRRCRGRSPVVAPSAVGPSSVARSAGCLVGQARTAALEPVGRHRRTRPPVAALAAYEG